METQTKVKSIAEIRFSKAVDAATAKLKKARANGLNGKELAEANAVFLRAYDKAKSNLINAQDGRGPWSR